MFNSLAHARREVVCLKTRSDRVQVQTADGEDVLQQVHGNYVYGRRRSLRLLGYEVGPFL